MVWPALPGRHANQGIADLDACTIHPDRGFCRTLLRMFGLNSGPGSITKAGGPVHTAKVTEKFQKALKVSVVKDLSTPSISSR